MDYSTELRAERDKLLEQYEYQNAMWAAYGVTPYLSPRAKMIQLATSALQTCNLDLIKAAHGLVIDKTHHGYNPLQHPHKGQ